MARREAAAVKGEGSIWARQASKCGMLFLLLTLLVSIASLTHNSKLVEQVLLSFVMVVVSFTAARKVSLELGGGLKAGLLSGAVLIALVCLCSTLVYKTVPQPKAVLVESCKIFSGSLLGSLRKENKRGPRRK